MQSYKIPISKVEKNEASIMNYAMILIFTTFLAFFSQAQNQGVNLETIKTVCIDAGHGGKDPGCLGAHSNEKTVCLNMALKLGEMIKKAYPSIKVVYTRDKDVFVELDDRAKIANKNNADLFICIHANSASPSAYGAETYVLGLHRTDAQQKIAERENSTILLEDDKGEKYKDFDMSPDAIIARQLQLSVFLNHSITFASKIQAEFKRIGRYDRGVKQAGFLVLYKTTMPSVLIETGFLTNADDEKFLRDTASQTKMAEAMFVAFQKYKNQLEGIDEMKGVKNPTPLVQNGNSTTNNTTSSAGSEDKSAKNEVVFKVQIETSDSKIPIKSPRFKGLKVWEYQQDNLFKYTVGEFSNDFEGANNYKNELREQGFKHAFVVVFQNGERISLEKGIKLASTK
jgi:N-acetylmuramoyl-L-alanine amidase